ncbi:GNAT family N-acetyltransferase [Crocosphaera chwakensis]|uniref:Aminoglycoside N6'-acetyltransferase n=1 Tax=Crocosphaera chwakensis CCY0110 TaxID=391612 RepID=A3IUL0_9CHRO|nr:GNAT family N-acetyltransferase [Crocosphaera chwakensis]EAZ89802.1 aminoglycoside N6'-acetyltransferase [Crocosphaera chwakensis CCY0110]
MVINLRFATFADLERLQYWDKQPHIIASNPNDQWNWEVELKDKSEGREQLIAELNDRPIGFIEITDPARDDSNYWGSIEENVRAIDIWIGEKKDLGKGYGTKMMQLALIRCFSNPLVTAIFVDPLANNTGAHRFYERLGFKFLEQRQFGNDKCCVYRLSRENWQH